MLLMIAWGLNAATAQAGLRNSSEELLLRALARPASIVWQKQPLAVGIERLSRTADVPIWLDRRVDPNATVDLAAADQPISEILGSLSAAQRCAVTPFHGVLYFGPRQSALELLTLSALAREPLDAAAAPVRAQWLAAHRWSIPRLSEPRKLLVELVQPTGATIVGAEAIPHDLLPAREMPAMAAIDRAVLLLAGFDLTCRLSSDGKQLRIVPVERPVQIVREYRVDPKRQTAVDSLLEDMQEAQAVRNQQRLKLTARIEEHELIDAALRAGPGPRERRRVAAKSSAQSGEQRFTLRIENQPVGRVVDHLAAQLKLSVDWDASVGADPMAGRNAMVSCDVSQVDLDDLLSAILAPAGLKAERAGERVLIKRADY